MPDRYLESHIKPLPMFQRLRPDELNFVLRAFQVLEFQAGDTVIKEGNETQGLFILAEGEGILLRTQPDGSQRRVGRLQPGDLLDRGALFQTGREAATVQMTAPSKMLFLSHRRMQTVLSRYPDARTRLSGHPTDSRPSHPASQPEEQPPSQPAAQSNAPQQPSPSQRATPEPATQSNPPRQQKPESIGDPTLSGLKRQDEQILLVQRRHPWAFIRHSWIVVLILIFAGVSAFYLAQYNSLLALVTVASGLMMGGAIFTYLYLEWRNDSMVVTDSRVIRIERTIPTFTVNINEIPLDRIQEVNTELPQYDLFARIFDYGSIELKNASDSGDLVLNIVPNPDRIQDIIFKRRSQQLEYDEELRRSTIRADLQKQLGVDTENPDAQSDAPPELKTPPKPPPADVWTILAPARMQFQNANGDTVYRKHVTVWLSHIIAPVLVLIGALAVLIVSLLGNIGAIGFPVAMAMFVFGGLWLWWSDWDWRNDMYILSDDHITLIHRRPLWLQNEVDQVLLNRVDNVVSETSGLLDSVLQRGNVQISMVGEGLEKAKRFESIHRPHDIQAELSRRQARAKAKKAREEQEQRQEDITQYLSVYHETMQNQQQQGEHPPPQG